MRHYTRKKTPSNSYRLNCPNIESKMCTVLTLAGIECKLRMRCARAMIFPGWENHDHAQSRKIVFQRNRRSMLLDDRCNQTQAEAAALGFAARFQPIERPKHPLPFLRRNASAAVGNDEARCALAAFRRDSNIGAGGRMMNRIVDEVYRHLHEQLAISMHDQARTHLCRQMSAVVTSRGYEILAYAGEQTRQVNGHQRTCAAPCFDLRDPQQCAERLENGVDIFDRSIQYLEPRFLAAIRSSCALKALTQPGQRSSQIMGNVIRHLLGMLHQLHDPVEHGVNADRQMVELVVDTAKSYTLGQIAGDDCTAGLA